jgi:hypothetical protein
VHAAFDGRMAHGDVYARISPAVRGNAPIVPHVVRPRACEGPDLRAELGIPRDALVFGRHGGYNGFDLPAAQQAVLRVATDSPTTFFLFVHTAPFGGEELPNIRHLPRCEDVDHLSRFVRTCDAMLHGRADGETFGLSVADFAAHGRPVIASGAAMHTDGGRSRHHLDVLGEYADRPTAKRSRYRSLLTHPSADLSQARHNIRWRRLFSDEAAARI